jgi:hypothetical protein
MAESGYDEINSKIKSSQTYAQVSADSKQLSKKAGSTFEDAKSNASQSLDKAKDMTKKAQKQVKSQLEELLGIIGTTKGHGGSTSKYLKRQITKTVVKIRPKIEEILYNESIKAIGCSQQQTYTNTFIYVKVKSVDIFGLLKRDPSSPTGKISYEKASVSYGSIPFSMNKELYYRVQNEGVSYRDDVGIDYKGLSGQPLFNIKYLDTHPITGDQSGWFEVELINRAQGPNKIATFVRDYYRTLKVVDTTNIFAQLMEALSGILSMDLNAGVSTVEDNSKFGLLIARILGICYDKRAEIDVQGTSKIGESDLIDQSFFEFNEIDLRVINDRTNNILNRVIEFEDCDNIKFPVEFQNTIESLTKLNFMEGEELVNNIVELTGDLLNINGPAKGIGFKLDIEGKLDFNFIVNLPRAIFSALISPKILLPIMVMIKYLGNTSADAFSTLVDFFKMFSKFVIGVVSKITAIFIEELFAIIKKDIVNLIQSFVNDLQREKADKTLIMILKLIQLIIIIAKFISDWRRCKSVIDEILQLLQLAKPNFGSEIPLPLLAVSSLLDGASATRGFINTIQEMQKKGLPTGNMPDGSPNLMLQALLSQSKGQSKEQAENGKAVICGGPYTILPSGQTVPKKSYGKSF